MEPLEPRLSESELIKHINKVAKTLGFGSLACRDVIHDNDGIRWTFFITGHKCGRWETQTYVGQTSREALVRMYHGLRTMAHAQMSQIASVLEY